ncbi:MAG: signal peptidase I [Cyanobacteria bacterium SIG30]|nr:signal peptidase I [Cyanobacteria bacterium SIG30]
MSLFDEIKKFYIKVKERELQYKIKTLTENFKNKYYKNQNKEKRNFKYFLNDFKEYFRKVFHDKVETYLFIKEIISTVVFVIVAVILIRFFIGELRFIPSASMRNTLIEGDRVFVQKMTFWDRELKRGDVIVFYPPDEILLQDKWSIFARLTGIFCKDIAYIKRIVAVGGDKFEIKQDKNGNSYVYINDKQIDEPYVLKNTNWPDCTSDKFCGPFVVPKDNYFMMGDNRANSLDSRFWGFLPKDRIVGRASFIFWPLNRIKKL